MIARPMRRESSRVSLGSALFLACTICNVALGDLDAESNNEHPVFFADGALIDAEAVVALTAAGHLDRMLKDKDEEKDQKDSKKDKKKKKGSKKEKKKDSEETNKHGKDSEKKDSHDKDVKKKDKHEKGSKNKNVHEKGPKKKDKHDKDDKKKDDKKSSSKSSKDSKSSAKAGKRNAPAPNYFSLIAKTVNTTACKAALKPAAPKPVATSSFSSSELTALLSRSTKATSFALKQADTSCVLRVESTSPARFCVSAVSLNATTDAPICVQEAEGSLVSDRGPLGSQLRKPMLCSVANSRLRTSGLQAGLVGGSFGGAAASRTAIVSSAISGTQLIFGDGTWLSFLNKLSYCEKTGRHLYLWLSPADWSPETSPPSTISTPFPSQLATSKSVPFTPFLTSSSWVPQCNLRKAPAGRSVKPLAVLATLQHAPTLPAAFFMELDAWLGDGVDAAVGNGTASLEDYLALAPEAGLVLAQSDYDKEAWCTGNVELLSTSAFFARTSTLSQGLLSAWFDLRCGIHDENPLLQLLLASIVATRKLGFSFDWRNLANHEEYNQNAVQGIGRQMESILKGTRSRWRGNLAFQMTGQLHAPLELPPGVLLLPTAPVSVATATTLPAFLSSGETGLATYVCEGKASSSQLPKCSMQSKCVGPGGPKDRCSVTLMKAGDWGMK